MHRTTPTIRRLAMWLATALLLVGCAGATTTAGSDDDVRTIDVAMADLAFQPASIEVADGETVRLRFTNEGELPHDAFIGDAAAQAAHGEEMAEEMAGGGHGGGHGADDPDAVTVQPGGTAELVHTFRAGESVLVGCHQPGHYDAGMVLSVDVR